MWFWRKNKKRNNFEKIELTINMQSKILDTIGTILEKTAHDFLKLYDNYILINKSYKEGKIDKNIFLKIEKAYENIAQKLIEIWKDFYLSVVNNKRYITQKFYNQTVEVEKFRIQGVFEPKDFAIYVLKTLNIGKKELKELIDEYGFVNIKKKVA